MTVLQLWADGVSHTVTGVGYAPTGEIADAGAVQELLRAAALCGNARLVPPAGRDTWRVLGDTTEGALLVAARKACLDTAQEEARTPRVAEYPSDSGNGFSRSVLETAGIAHADAFVAVTSGNNSNIVSARTAKETYRGPIVLARIHDPRRADIYRDLGIPTISSVR